MTRTAYATFCNALKADIVATFPTAHTVKKLHVPAVGYVYYIKDAAGSLVAKCYRENGAMVIA